MVTENATTQAMADFTGKNLIILSNREPYAHKKKGLSMKVERPTDGLTSALKDATGRRGNTGGMGERRPGRGG